MKKKNRLFVLSGPSGSGKSTLLSKIVNEKLCEQILKYSAREIRGGWLDKELGGIVKDDVVSKNIDWIKKYCDIKYKMYKQTYGVASNEIKNVLVKNNGIVIISKTNAIIRIKNMFKNTEIVFILIDEICIRKLFTSYLSRQLKTCDDELLLIADKISDSIKANDKKMFNTFDKIFKEKTKGYFTVAEYEEFIERYKSWINSKKDYDKNRYLFTKTISGNTISELYEKSCQIITGSKK